MASINFPFSSAQHLESGDRDSSRTAPQTEHRVVTGQRRRGDDAAHIGCPQPMYTAEQLLEAAKIIGNL